MSAPGDHRRTAMLAVLALLACLVPMSGPLAWLRFVVAAVLVAAATLSHRDGPAWVAAALFAALAFKDGVRVVPGAHVGLFHVVLAGAALAVVLRAVRGGARTPSAPIGLEWALGLLPLAGLWSLPTSLDPGQTALHIARLAMLWLAALLVSRLLSDREAQDRAVTALAVTGGLLAALAFFQWLAPDVAIGSIHRSGRGVAEGIRPAGFYLDPNFLGAHLALAALAALSIAGSRRPWWPWLLAALATLGAVVITYSRSAWVAVVAGMAALLVTGGTRLRVAVIGIGIAGVIVGAALLGPGEVAGRISSILDADTDSSNATRVLMMRSSIAMIADRPVFGTGLKAYEDAYPDYALPGSEPGVTHPHQVPLALVAETGFMGVVALGAVFTAGVASMLRVRRLGSVSGRVATAGLVAVGVGSFFQYFLYFELAWLMAGLLAAVVRAERGLTTRPGLGKE
ncbi:MAG: O-antigen ligase family protein [Aeromicrobium sp.]|nr:O-antigen ligase family protein [Aeromicrobium sp.]